MSDPVRIATLLFVQDIAGTRGSSSIAASILDWGSSIYGDFLYDVAKLVFYQPWYAAWRNIDFVAEASAHYDAIGLEVPRFRERLICYMLRIGIGDMAYSAFRKRWDQVEWKSRRTLEIARA